MKARSGLGLVLVGLVALPVLSAGAALRQTSQTAAPEAMNLVARGGGGGGGGSRGGGGGGNRGGGGGSRAGGGGGNRGGGGGGRTGISNAGGGGLNRGASRPEGGWSSNARGPRAGGSPSLDRRVGGSSGGGLDRGGVDRSGSISGNRQPLQGSGSGSLRGDRGTAGTNLGDRNLGDRNLGDRNLGNRNLNQNFNRNVERNWNRTVNINNVNLHPGWARPGWGYARPWNYGWYGGWATPTWGWWGARAAVWGIGSLATAAIINEAVDNAINSQQTMIIVPNSNYQLLYGTVQPTGSNSVQFNVSVDGSTYQLTADCQSGLLNGVQPASSAEAELLNAACQVAFGNS